ncbi:iron ABC transporter permease [Sporosarcina sp. Te-1]|uniref:FecCD family ABC transporter permease n=1 Tax=Sporosarcina sp. Te-1 TaxID=2818390 RepID=UPI001A9D232F|nr:iron ABC transporter permease [Sporosarcina sp. Te-1]QTD41850.1 iron ABC transporter permease [Sporosarcina sp. Te-1]
MSMMRKNPILLLPIILVLFIITIICSIMYGATTYHLSTVWHALFHTDMTNMDHLIIRTSRLPRVIGALLVGLFIAVSGALMQGMTRNYLASPSIMGVSDGSVFVITISMIFMPNGSPFAMIIYSFIGSILGLLFVLGVARLIPNGMSPISLAIIGTILGMFLNGVSQALSTYYQVSQNISFWYNTRLHQIDPIVIKWAIPFAVIGLLIAWFVGKSITAVSLGDEVAQGLGINLLKVKLLTILSVALLTGVSVAMVGKITFIGLVIPHIARFLVGEDYKRVIFFAGLLGALLLAWADIFSRAINPPFETPVGVVTALIGVPFFLYLIKVKGGNQHA